MAIRDVGGKATMPTSQGPQQPSAALTQSMTNAGALPKGGDPQQALQQLVSNLKAQGFAAPPGLPLAAQLRQALVQAQKKNNLPQTGNLDNATTALLNNLGVIKQPEGQKGSSQKDGFERIAPQVIKADGGPKKSKAEEQAQQQAPNADFVDGLLNMLGGGGAVPGEASREVGGKAVFGVGQGVQAENAKGQAAVTGAANAGDQAETAGPTKREADAPMQAHGLERGDAKGVKVARGLQAKETRTDEKSRASTTSRYEPTSRGVDDGDDDDMEGAGDEGQKKRGRGGGHEGAADEGSVDAAAGTDAEGGTERDAGNATSGDRDESDRRRGNAGEGDDELGEGHWRMPSASEQAWAALDKIVKDRAEENRATTYTWDVMFYRPAVYGPGQKAQEVLHLVVQKATAFDPVWQKAVDNLAALVHRFEKNAKTPMLDDVVAALRQARVKEGDKSAATLSKQALHRSMKA